MKIAAIGIPWYRKEDYEALRALFTDGDKLHSTYEGWLASAELGEAHQRTNGLRVVRAIIEPTAFAAWCSAEGMQRDAKARMAFASEVAHRTITSDGPGA